MKKILLKISFIKAYYVGKEILKSPPKVIVNGNIEGFTFINTTVEANENSKAVAIRDCSFIKTFDIN